MGYHLKLLGLLATQGMSNTEFSRPKSISLVIQEAVVEELDRPKATGISEKISHADWAAPIVAIPKKDG